jgi:hypothetical protein
VALLLLLQPTAAMAMASSPAVQKDVQKHRGSIDQRDRDANMG